MKKRKIICFFEKLIHLLLLLLYPALSGSQTVTCSPSLSNPTVYQSSPSKAEKHCCRFSAYCEPGRSPSQNSERGRKKKIKEKKLSMPDVKSNLKKKENITIHGNMY